MRDIPPKGTLSLLERLPGVEGPPEGGTFPLVVSANTTLGRTSPLACWHSLSVRFARAADQPARWPLLNPARSLDAQVTAELMQRAVPQGFSLLKLVRCAALAQALPCAAHRPVGQIIQLTTPSTPEVYLPCRWGYQLSDLANGSSSK